MRNNPVDPGFFQIWDAEKSLASYGSDGRKQAWYSPLLTQIDTRGGRAVPSRIWKAMITNPDFKLIFADQVYRNIVKADGQLTNENSISRWKELNDFIGAADRNHAAIIGESARWGDINIDYSISKPAKYSDWIIPVNEAIVSLSSNKEKFYSEFHSLLNQPIPPKIYVNDREEEESNITLSSAYQIYLENLNPNGILYYRTDGQDPRIFGGSSRGQVRPGTDVFLSSLNLNQQVSLTCRVYINGDWSALNYLDISHTVNTSVVSIDADARVYPNPFSDIIYFRTPGLYHVELKAEIYNLLGQIMYSEIVSQSANDLAYIQTGELRPGSFFFVLKSTSGDVLIRKTLIKTK
jgi:hypothetical protein